MTSKFMLFFYGLNQIGSFACVTLVALDMTSPDLWFFASLASYWLISISITITSMEYIPLDMTTWSPYQFVLLGLSNIFYLILFFRYGWKWGLIIGFHDDNVHTILRSEYHRINSFYVSITFRRKRDLTKFLLQNNLVGETQTKKGLLQ